MFTFVKLYTLSAVVVALAVMKVNSQGTRLPADCARNYTVQSGDFCDKISAEQHSSTYQLAASNVGVINVGCTNLAVGEPLCLGITGKDCQTTVVIQSGNGCDTISAAANITIGDLLTNNPNVNAQCTNIYPGEVLCVAPVSNSTAPA